MSATAPAHPYPPPRQILYNKCRPIPTTPFDPEDIPYFFDNWCSLPWTPWVPFNADKHTFKEIPHEPGLYRIRPAGKDFLMYIGGTGRTLHLRLNDLRQSLRRADLMPWSDPLPEAPASGHGGPTGSQARRTRRNRRFLRRSEKLASTAPPAVPADHSPEDEDLPEAEQHR